MAVKKDISIQLAKDVLKIEAESISGLIGKLNENFTKAVDTIFKSNGRVIVTGIGKSGLIGKKIVATLTSTGTQAIFLHPVEGMHGDLGIVTKNDIVLAISNSGETHELSLIVNSVREIGATLIALTGDTNSSLARSCNLVIDVGVEREACPFGLTPTSSSTATLAMGDALAIALIEKRKFNEKDFYKFHPGGNLGMRLRAKVKEVMISYARTPKVLAGVTATRAIEEMDANNKGFVLVTDRKRTLLGIFTDGDLRRLVKRGVSFHDKIVDQVMTRNPKTIDENISLAQTIESMQRDEITTLVVANGENTLKGYIHLHDILGRGGTLKIALP